MRCAFDCCHGAAKPEPVLERRRQLLDTALAAAFDCAPDRPVAMQQTMVVEEGNEILGREVEHLATRHSKRPPSADRAKHMQLSMVSTPRWANIAVRSG
jgi:hypothetical protein